MQAQNKFIEILPEMTIIDGQLWVLTIDGPPGAGIWKKYKASVMKEYITPYPLPTSAGTDGQGIVFDTETGAFIYADLTQEQDFLDSLAAIRSDIPAAASTNTVHVIATLADTTTIVSPVEADIAWVSSDTIAFRSGAMWRVFIDDNNSSMYTGGTFETGTTNDLLEDAIASYSTRFRSPSIGTWMGITSDTANNKLGLRWSTLQGTHEVMSSSSGLQLLSGSDLTFRLSNSLKRFYFDGTFDTDDTNTTALAVDPVSFELERVSIVTPDMLSDSLSQTSVYNTNGTLSGDRTISANGNTLTIAGAGSSNAGSLQLNDTETRLVYGSGLNLSNFQASATGIGMININGFDAGGTVEVQEDSTVMTHIVSSTVTAKIAVTDNGISVRLDTISGGSAFYQFPFAQPDTNTILGNLSGDSNLEFSTIGEYQVENPFGGDNRLQAVIDSLNENMGGSAGITSLNGLTGPTQTFATGTGPLAWSSTGTAHTLNIPNANALTRGFVSTTAQTFAGDKTFSGTISAAVVSSNFISTPILTASGLFIDGNSSAGSAGQVLSSTGSAVEWVDGGSWAQYAQSHNAGGENTSITAGVPEPINLTTTGTITEVAETSQFTIAANGNIQYTGPSNSVIEIEIDGSVSTGGAAQMYYYVSISGTTQATSRTRHDHDGAGYEHFSIKWIDTDADAGDTYSVSVEPVTGTESVTISDLRITATKIK